MMLKTRFCDQEQNLKWDKPPTFVEFVDAQAEDLNCQQYAASVGHPDWRFYVDDNEPLVRQSTIDEAIQTVLPKALQARLLYLAQHPPLAGHP